MAIKFLSAGVAVVLVLAFVLPVVFKLKEISLGVIVLIGIAMMLVDLWQSLKSGEE